ncbi:unnamed protein product [Sphagnum balticum]
MKDSYAHQGATILTYKDAYGAEGKYSSCFKVYGKERDPLGVLGFIVYTQQQLKSQQTAIQTSLVAQQQLVDGIVRSQSQYATAADLAKFASDNDINLKAIQDNLISLGSQLSSINVISANSTGQTGNNIPSTGTGPSNPNPPPPTVTCTNGVCPNQDPYGYQQKQQDLASMKTSLLSKYLLVRLVSVPGNHSPGT